jgi:hypothetical protein
MSERDRELIEEFAGVTNEILDDSEKASIGIVDRKGFRGVLEDSVQSEISSYNRTTIGDPLVPIQGKDSDAELIFRFEDKDDAVDLYNFMLETKLLEPGEILLRDIEEQYSVAFMPHVIIQKPEVIQAALLAYEEQLDIGEEDEEAFEGLIEDLSVLLEAPTKTAGAPKRKKEMGNPFHDKDTGKFSGVSSHASKGGGSWAYKKTKLKFTGKGKTKEGGLLGKYGSTKHPCGRAARKAGKDIRCWDGKQGAGMRIGKALGKKKRTGESLSIADLSLMMELRDKYSRIQ